MFLGTLFFVTFLSGSKKKLFVLLQLFVVLGIMFAGPITTSSIKGAQIKHDGSRTGPRVSYQSYCDPTGGYVIHENEKLEFTKDDGEVVYWTKDDIECYKKDMLANKTNDVNLKVTNKPVVKNNEPLISCTGPDYKTFMTTKEKCNEFNQAWNNTNSTTLVKSPSVPSQSSFDYTAWDVCSENVKKTVYQPCADSCSATFTKDSDMCYWAYGDTSAAMEYNWDKYMECENEVTQNFTSCLNECSSVILPQALTRQCSQN